MDLSVRYALPSQKMHLTFSIRNIADAQGVYPSEPYTYIHDYPQQGRTFDVAFVKEF